MIRLFGAGLRVKRQWTLLALPAVLIGVAVFWAWHPNRPDEQQASGFGVQTGPEHSVPQTPDAGVDAVADELVAVAADAPPTTPADAPAGVRAPAIDAELARQLMRERQRRSDCLYARSTRRQAQMHAYEQAVGRWLHPGQVEAELSGWQASLSRLGQGCDDVDSQSQQRARAGRRTHDAERDAAAAAGDLWARLEQARNRPDRHTDAGVEAVRELLYQAAAANDLELLPAIADLIRNESNPRRFGVSSSDTHQVMLRWQLAACTLGLECGPGSRVMDLVCLQYRSCSRPDLTSALIEVLAPRQMALLEAQAQELAQRLRRGDLAGMFEALPPDPGG